MPIESFSFRLACYEQFHWTPEQVKDVPLAEAERLAIYFEETGAYHHKLRKEAESNSPSTPRTDKEVVFELGTEEEEEEDDEYGDG